MSASSRLRATAAGPLVPERRRIGEEGRQMATVRADVDHDLCAGVAQCLRMAPGAFRLDSELLSVFDPSGPYTSGQLEDAVANCPMEAISLRPPAG
jgi:ferredoxin